MRTEIRELPVTIRTETGKGARKQLRANGRIPAIVYGRQLEQNVSVAVEERTFKRTLPESGWYSIPLKLVVQDPAHQEFTPTVMITEVQHDLAPGTLIAPEPPPQKASSRASAELERKARRRPRTRTRAWPTA